MRFEPQFFQEFKYNIVDYVKLKIQDVIFNIEVRYNDSIDYKFDKLLLKKYLTELIKLFYEIDGIRKLKQINILYYPLKDKKFIPKKGEPIDVGNVNSGYCYINSNETETNIVIYRQEEFHKVLLHELIHLYDIIPFDINYDNYINTKYKLTNHINTNEALVELNALIFNCIIIHKLTNSNLDDLLSKEVYWCKYLSNKLKKHLNPWKENSNAFAYYILKYELFKNIYNNELTTIKKRSLRMTINDIINFKTT